MTRKLSEGEKLRRLLKKLFCERLIDPWLVLFGIKHAAWKPKNRKGKTQDSLPGFDNGIHVVKEAKP